ncbi:membrane cofactor protein-like isoform X1 [Vicugna pacos]|uniref:Membrane cofactor protein n=1 Tax=Vicugna pacos TaxID=30538 RepID=A0ABM5C7C8_VICPA
MAASYTSLVAPSGRPESPLLAWCFFGILLTALVLLLPIFSDACDSPPRFQTMKLQGAAKPSYSSGETVKYECRPGYKPIFPPLPTSTVCQDDNTWAQLMEACTRKLCPNLGDPVNGQVICVNESFAFGTQAHFVCNEGFYIIGEKILHCEISENTVAWNDNPPICEKIKCSRPTEIENGRYTNSHKDIFEYNEAVTYICDPSSGPDEYSLVGESRLVCVGSDTWSSDAPQCKVVKCIYPIVDHGTMVSGFRAKYYYKAEVVFECDKGFSLRGKSRIVCGADSTWEPELPTCVKALIPATTKHPYSSVSGSQPSSCPPTTPVSSSTGHPSLPDDLHSEDLDVGLIAVIVLTVVAAITVSAACLYKCFMRRQEEN